MTVYQHTVFNSVTYFIYFKAYYSSVDRLVGLVGRVFANGPGDLGSIPGRVIPKNLKMVLDTSLLKTRRYKVRIESKVEKSWEKSSALSLYTYTIPLLVSEHIIP